MARPCDPHPPDPPPDMLDVALAAIGRGDGAAAELLIRGVLDDLPDHAEALSILGLALQVTGRPEEARRALVRSIELDPGSADAHYNLGELLARSGDPAGGSRRFEACVAIDPAHEPAWRRLAELRADAGDDAAALIAAERAASLAPDDGLLAVAVGRHQMKLKLWPAAFDTLTRATRASPDLLPAWVMLYRTATVLGRPDDALASADRAATIAPGSRKVHLDRIDLLTRFGRSADALVAAGDYVVRFREDPDGHRRLAAAFMAEREFGGAARAAAAAVELAPEDGSAYAMLGEVLLRMGRAADALPQLDRALEHEPDLVSAQLFRSIALDHLNWRDAAVDQARRILDAHPDDLEVSGWLGQLLFRGGQHAAAAEQFRRVLDRSPDDPVALTGMAMLAGAQGRPGEAWTLYERAFAARTDDPVIIATALMAANAHPGLSAERVFGLHQEWARRLVRRLPQPPFDRWANDPNPDRRLRVGYLSADFRAHSVAYFMQPLVAAHDRARVELVGFDNTPTPDPITTHLRGSFAEWHRIVGVGDPRVADLIRECRIDVLVDLNGHTAESRLNVLALRPAPVQVTYLGYPNTTGLPGVDYRITDAAADPPGEADALATERLVRLDGGFLCFNPPKPYPDVSPLPAGDAGPVTFGAFNAVHKINDRVIAAWCDVLRAVPGSRLLLKANGLDDGDTRRYLAESFDAHGMAGDRVTFLPRTGRYLDHLATYGRCDLALDTFPYNGTTTTCEALWMGVPVVTLAGDRHAARVGLSILTQLGLTELAADTADGYVRAAAGLVADRPRLDALRTSLRERMRASRLMDAPAHAAVVEAAYRQMWRDWCATVRPGPG